ncbi:MAG: hypothetical protein QOF48_915 [Verrucomicrobiota bacterium]|jgi:hypothetical protein
MGLQKTIFSRLAAAFVLLAGMGSVDSALAACSYQLTPIDRTHGFGATTAKVSVASSSASCAWTASNTNGWITILSGASGTGDADVTYAVAGNPNPGTRTGILRIAGQDFTVIQTGVSCTYSISPSTHDKCYGSTTGSVQITTQSPCPWTIVNPNDWILITSDNSGVGSDKVFYTVLANNGSIARTGNVLVAGQVFTIVQSPYPASCATNKQVECGAIWDFNPPAILGPDVVSQTMTTVTNFLCGKSFIAIRTWTITDRCGNVATCSQTVTATDATPPVLSCFPAKSVECGAPWTFDLPSASDNCDGTNVAITIVSTATNFGCGRSFSATRVWRATDACGNARACSQTVSSVDNTPPVLSCFLDKIVVCGATWSFDPPTATDGCDGTNVAITVVSTVTNLGCGRTFSATRVWRATDACGNSATCSQTVTTSDTTPPVLTCFLDKIVECGTAWAFNPPTVTDGCDGTNVAIVISGTVTNSRCGKTFIAIRTWRATDACGNASTCSQTVTIVDATPPLLTCAPDAFLDCTMPWSFPLPAVTDSCDGTSPTIAIVSTITNLGCGQGMTAVRTWRATDACGNAATCSQTIRVTNMALVVICPPNQVVPCTATWTFGSPVMEGCGFSITMLSTTTNFFCGATCTATRIWRITDGCVTTNCTQTVQVTDLTPPVIVCLPDVTVTNISDVPHCPKTLTEFILGGGATSDDCGAVHYRCVDSPLSDGPCGGVIERTHVVYDACFNTNVCIQRITVMLGTTVAISVQAADTNIDICLGGTLTFCAAPSGAGPFFYNWMVDGLHILGADGPCLTITNLNPIDATRYTVQVISQCETVTKTLSLPGCGPAQPLMVGIQFVPAGVRLTFKGLPEQTYRILRGADLVHPWVQIGTTTAAINGAGEFLDTSGNAGECRMYKLVAPSNP